MWGMNNSPLVIWSFAFLMEHKNKKGRYEQMDGMETGNMMTWQIFEWHQMGRS